MNLGIYGLMAYVHHIFCSQLGRWDFVYKTGMRGIWFDNLNLLCSDAIVEKFCMQSGFPASSNRLMFTNKPQVNYIHDRTEWAFAIDAYVEMVLAIII